MPQKPQNAQPTLRESQDARNIRQKLACRKRARQGRLLAAMNVVCLLFSGALLFPVCLQSGNVITHAAGAVLSLVLLGLALLAWRGAGGMEEALRQAGRVEDMERLFNESRRQHRLSDYLRTLTARLALEFDCDTLLEQVAAEVCALGYAGCAIPLLETGEDSVRSLEGPLVFAEHPESVRFRATEDSPGLSALIQGEKRQRHDLAHPTGDSAELRAQLDELGVTEQFSLPIRYQGAVLGCLIVWASPQAWGQTLGEEPTPELLLQHSDAPEGGHREPFRPAAVGFLSTLADHVALALGNALLHREMNCAHARLEEHHRTVAAQAQEHAEMNAKLLEVQTKLEAQYLALEAANRQLEARATTDGMTGLANHRAFQEELARQAARSVRSEGRLSLLLLDVDKFKEYNDSFGHPAGDEVLRTMGNILRALVREGDFAARYGGEEFAVILPDTDGETAAQVAERIREAVENTPFPLRPVTASVGVTEHIAGELLDALVQRADVGLYEAKSAGRNRVVHIHSQFADEPEFAEDLPQEEARYEDDFLTLDRAEREEEIENAPVEIVAEIEQLARMLAQMEGNLDTSRVGGLHHATAPDGGIEGMLQEPSAQILTELMAALDRREAESRGHSERVARYALRLGEELVALYEELRSERWALPRLTPSDLTALACGALFHDIGKISIPNAILRKTESLNGEEWRQMRRHPLAGAELIADHPLLARALPVVRFHHERWDGTGYPQGLAGDAIPLAARIFAVCDAYDSLTTDKPYRARLDYAAARQEIVRASGTQFDPDMVAAFLRVPEAEWSRLRAAGTGLQTAEPARERLSRAA